MSPSSLKIEDVSDSESIFDSSKEIRLKKELEQKRERIENLVKKIKKVQRQNRTLKKRNEVLIAILREKLGDDFVIEWIAEITKYDK